MRTRDVLSVLASLVVFSSRPGVGGEPKSAWPEAMRALAEQGKGQFEKGDYAAAEKTYRAMVAEAPENLYGLSNLAVVLFRRGNLPEAEQVFKRALHVAPNDTFCLSTLGIMRYTQGHYLPAVDVLNRAVMQDPKNETALRYLAVAAAQAGLTQTAEAAMERLKAVSPESAGEPENSLQGDFLTPVERTRLQLPPAARK